MTPPHFQIGQEVEIVGSPIYEIAQEWHPKDFTIGQVETICGETVYSTVGIPWYPASSLRLVEDLKVGDWVEVIGPCLPEYEKIDDVFRISQIGSENGKVWYSTGGAACYPATSLRKLAPDEIAKHLGKFTAEQRLDSLEDYVRENDERLSAIEKRLAILEGKRPETCDRQHGTESIRVSIQRGNDPARIFVDTCSVDCLIWAKKVLDSMRGA